MKSGIRSEAAQRNPSPNRAGFLSEIGRKQKINQQRIKLQSKQNSKLQKTKINYEFFFDILVYLSIFL